MVDQDIQTNSTETEDLDTTLVAELDISITDLIDEILDRSAYTPVPPGAFTVTDFMSRTGVTRDVARNILNLEVESARLLTTLTHLPGKSRVRVWWKNDDLGR